MCLPFRPFYRSVNGNFEVHKHKSSTRFPAKWTDLLIWVDKALLTELKSFRWHLSSWSIWVIWLSLMLLCKPTYNQTQFGVLDWREPSNPHLLKEGCLESSSSLENPRKAWEVRAAARNLIPKPRSPENSRCLNSVQGCVQAQNWPWADPWRVFHPSLQKMGSFNPLNAVEPRNTVGAHSGWTESMIWCLALRLKWT